MVSAAPGLAYLLGWGCNKLLLLLLPPPLPWLTSTRRPITCPQAWEMRSGRHRGLPFQLYKNSATAANKLKSRKLVVDSSARRYKRTHWHQLDFLIHRSRGLSLSLNGKFYFIPSIYYRPLVAIVSLVVSFLLHFHRRCIVRPIL